MSNIITILCGDIRKRLKTWSDVTKLGADDQKDMIALTNALKLESPVYTIVCRDTALPQLVMLRDRETGQASLSMLLFSEKEMAENEVARLGNEHVFVADIPKFLLRDREPIDIRAAFYRKCILLGLDKALLNPHDGNAEFGIPIRLLAEESEIPETDQEEINRHVNGAVTFLKQETCAGKLSAPLLLEQEVMRKMQFALFQLPTSDSHPLIFIDQEYGDSLYLFTNNYETWMYEGDRSNVMLEDLIPLIKERNLSCIINPFSLKFYLDSGFMRRFEEVGKTK